MLAQLAVDLSRLSEDVILWVTDEFGFAVLDDAWSTGFGMPRRRTRMWPNSARDSCADGQPDRLLAMLKGLPLAYNR